MGYLLDVHPRYQWNVLILICILWSCKYVPKLQQKVNTGCFNLNTEIPPNAHFRVYFSTSRILIFCEKEVTKVAPDL